jgi:hypothetical protein
MFATTVVIVLLFLLAFVVQEHLEFRKFVEPHKGWLQKLWLALTVFVQTAATAGFIPLCKTLARTGDCSVDEASGIYWLDALNSTINSTQAVKPMQCFTTEHWLNYAGPGLILFVLFVTLSARLMRAGGQLQNIGTKTIRISFIWLSSLRSVLLLSSCC